MMKKLISDMKRQNQIKMTFDTSDFDALLKTIVWSRDNFIKDYTDTLKAYSDKKIMFPNEYELGDYYSEVGFEFDNMKKILIQSFFDKYIFYMERLKKTLEIHTWIKTTVIVVKFIK